MDRRHEWDEQLRGQAQHLRQRQQQRADMVTPADFATFKQQLRQEVADVIQQLRAEVNEAISGRKDMLNSINTALQNVSDQRPHS